MIPSGDGCDEVYHPSATTKEGRIPSYGQHGSGPLTSHSMTERTTSALSLFQSENGARLLEQIDFLVSKDS